MGIKVSIRPSFAFQIVSTIEPISPYSFITPDNTSIVDVKIIDRRFEVLNVEIKKALEQYLGRSWIYRLFNYLEVNLSADGYEQLLKFGREYVPAIFEGELYKNFDKALPKIMDKFFDNNKVIKGKE